ncbi:antibiotic biosynthesis monooxygenase [Proteus hauseri ATCC 700826]|uniref:Antibiotic biosynthesis monooxygenase n=1 Tax=Proteus hauseri ATCC 700826 TaxID=1354271 RepID=A0AAJ3HRP9_PROHU|nr:antibiotic biosynthesis monooxygenase [Proteus hauseri]OAT46135.1 antibiotic biosynthesis monooxygenase [Proteus hauseri ATCC 700826]
MIAVIFELKTNEEQQQNYLTLAQDLKKILVNIDGFISIERFQSLSDNDKLLSLSFWQSENAIMQWRNTELHRMAQARGRHSILQHYRLRVASVIRDYGFNEREHAPQDSVLYHQSSENEENNNLF